MLFFLLLFLSFQSEISKKPFYFGIITERKRSKGWNVQVFFYSKRALGWSFNVRSTGSQERWTKQKQRQTKDQIENVDLFKETNMVNIFSRERM